MEYICFDCPRNCGAKRDDFEGYGFCRSPYLPYVTRCAPHFGEEPCITGVKGSGAVFFSGCNLMCSFCQNAAISRNCVGKKLSVVELRDAILRLQDLGVHNINLVTPTHYTKVIVQVLSDIKLDVPVVWNSSGYEKVETLKLLDGLVDIYMPDFKFIDSALSSLLSSAEDYAETAKCALAEMYRQVGKYVLDENGIMKKGLLIRHLALPGYSEDSMSIMDYIADTYSDSVLFSLMSQYTPMGNIPESLNKTLTEEENKNLIHYMKLRKLDGFCQDVSSSVKDMIPDFDLTGV